MSVSMLLNSDDPSDKASRRERENGRIPINSLLSRTNDDNRPRHHPMHPSSTSTSHQRHDALYRQSSMYVDRRSTTSRAPLPSFASLHQSFHYSENPNDIDHRADRQSLRKSNLPSHLRSRDEMAPSGLGGGRPDQKYSSSTSGKSLTRTKSVPYVSSSATSSPSSKAASSSTTAGPSSSKSSITVPSSPPTSSASSSAQNSAGNGINQNPPRRRWKPWEDQLLIKLVNEQGPQRWNTIAQGFPGRNGRQVRLRWMNHLQPSLDKRLWRPEEDAILLAAHKELGNKWALIAMRLNGRTDNSVKNRYKSIARRAARSTGQSMEK